MRCQALAWSQSTIDFPVTSLSGTRGTEMALPGSFDLWFQYDDVCGSLFPSVPFSQIRKGLTFVSTNIFVYVFPEEKNKSSFKSNLS